MLGNRSKYGFCSRREQERASFPIMAAFAMTKWGAKEDRAAMKAAFFAIELPNRNAVAPV
jgi:hypothetical protein